MIKILENKHSGFTLIEIVLTLVVVAVVGAWLVPYLGTVLTQSSVPIQRLKQSLELQQVMENITEDYRNDPSLTGLQTLKTNIENNDYGGYTYDTIFIEFAGTPPIESTPPAEDNLLKVTISNGSGDTLTALFSVFQ